MTDGSRLGSTVAVVTGASSGIGEATALALAAQGATVVAVARRADRLDDLAARIAASGAPAPHPIQADLTDPAQPPRVVAEALERAGRLDILVNNAGVMLLGPAVPAPLEEWEQMLEINVRALLHMTKAALPHLLEAAARDPRHVADLVNVSSVAGRTVTPTGGVYNLTKHGLGAFSESLRMEVARRRLRVGLLEPGVTETELASHMRAEVRDAMGQRFAGIERLQASDIAEAIVYMVTRPARVAVNEMLVRPTDQDF